MAFLPWFRERGARVGFGTVLTRLTRRHNERTLPGGGMVGRGITRELLKHGRRVR